MRDSYIGGEMEIHPGALWGNILSHEFMADEQYVPVQSGRAALLLALQAIRRRNKKKRLTAVLPSYLCPSILKPFQQEGFETHFFAIESDLNVNEQSLGRAVETQKPEVLLFINYFGFPVSESVAAILKARNVGCCLIEDCAQGSLLGPRSPMVGNLGDFLITSLRKYLPVPDGGFLVNRAGFPLPQLCPRRSRFADRMFLGKLLRGFYLESSGESGGLEKLYLSFFSEAEEELEKPIHVEPMSHISFELVHRIDFDAANRRRRENFQFLLQAFGSNSKLKVLGKPLFTSLPRNVSPLAFPILVSDGRRDSVRADLIKRGVFCPVHWHLPPDVNSNDFPASHRLSKSILSIPIDQRYTIGDMGKMARLLACVRKEHI
jgi:dTDP-4-amino-4,6-dideoxygalactose transaminase